MPITINDCKCGRQAVVIETTVPWEKLLGCEICNANDCNGWVDVSQYFLDGVKEWNERNQIEVKNAHDD